MIHYENFELSNGLHVFVHEDSNTQIAVVNILYNVGSRDESESKTGFAHLFEHLMFGGSANIASYDEPLQKVGGENNAFTTPDITNYYLTVPANNLEHRHSFLFLIRQPLLKDFCKFLLFLFFHVQEMPLVQ